MTNEELTRNIVELREFEAGTREQIHTIFNRLDKQDALIESMRELTATWARWPRDRSASRKTSAPCGRTWTN